jgi:hypothetical protein
MEGLGDAPVACLGLQFEHGGGSHPVLAGALTEHRANVAAVVCDGVTALRRIRD